MKGNISKLRTDSGAVKGQIGELETRTANNESGVAEAKGRLGAVESMYGDLVAEIDEIKDTKADKSSTYTKTDIDSKMGDIETALDSIIAIQNNLMGVSE